MKQNLDLCRECRVYSKSRSCQQTCSIISYWWRETVQYRSDKWSQVFATRIIINSSADGITRERVWCYRWNREFLL